MPQDDYGKVLFMILYGLYDDLKNGKPANLDDISPATLGVNESYWLSIVEEALEDGFVKGPTIRQTKFGRIVGGLEGMTITRKGVDFLKENSQMKKVYEMLKEARDWIPVF